MTALTLQNFRNYDSAAVHLPPGVTVFVGRNGQGKTNLVEAVVYLSTAASHRVTADEMLVQQGHTEAVIGAQVDQDGRNIRIDMTIARRGRNKVTVNKNKQQRTKDACGILRTVVFAPEDLAVVKGDPSGRRRFIDDLLSQLSPRFASIKADYDRVLKQRNALLRAGHGAVDDVDLTQLAVFDDQFAGLAADISVAREYACDRLIPHVQASYASLVGADHDVAITYDPASGIERGAQSTERAAQYIRRLGQLRDAEAARGVTLVGPHRDDVVLTLRGMPAKGYASHGESWSLALALRFASYVLLRDEGAGSLAAREPVVILDDVFAELDAHRRARLVDMVAGVEQLLVTVAAEADIPAGLTGARFSVDAGVVTADDAGVAGP